MPFTLRDSLIKLPFKAHKVYFKQHYQKGPHVIFERQMSVSGILRRLGGCHRAEVKPFVEAHGLVHAFFPKKLVKILKYIPLI